MPPDPLECIAPRPPHFPRAAINLPSYKPFHIYLWYLVKIQIIVESLFFFGNFSHCIVNSRNQNVSLYVDECAKESNEIWHCFITKIKTKVRVKLIFSTEMWTFWKLRVTGTFAKDANYFCFKVSVTTDYFYKTQNNGNSEDWIHYFYFYVLTSYIKKLCSFTEG